uniref:hypothetical protein n=1 Tax=Herbidospora sakaeratensis TaxID=564415 RepID=UPI000785B1EB|nr:hypothetical protein [Herbidospora sakaeratensis]
MGLPEAVDALRRQWPQVLASLEADAARRLTALRQDIEAGRPLGGPAALELARILLSLPDNHPVRRTLLTTSTRLAGGTGPPPARQGARAVQPEAEAALLGAPSYSPLQVRRAGFDPHDALLIRLAGPDGAIRLPAFQFDADGGPVPVVMEINELLDAEHDPWGVADWWLSHNTWIGASPAQALGRMDDEALLRVARNVMED